jgi:hypothetical protein
MPLAQRGEAQKRADHARREQTMKLVKHGGYATTTKNENGREQG